MSELHLSPEQESDEMTRMQAAQELTRIIHELIKASRLTNKRISELMGYKARNIIYDMRNYRYGQGPLYPAPALDAFLRAVGVRWPQDVDYVFSIYDIVAGRKTTQEREVVRPERRSWWEQSPVVDTEEVQPLDHKQRMMLAHLLN